VNLKHNGGIPDLNDTPNFSRRVNGASRLAQTTGIIFVRHDKKATRLGAPQLDGPAFQHVFKRLRLPRFLPSIQRPPRNAQVVRHGVFAPLEVRQKRDKRGKSSLPLAFTLFSRFSRPFTGCKPALDRPAAGVFLLELNYAAFAQDAQRGADLLGRAVPYCIVSLPGGVFTAAGAGVKTNLLFFTKGGPTRQIWYYDLSDIKVGKKKPFTLDKFADFFDRLPARSDSDRSWTVPRADIDARNYDLKAVNPNAKSNEDTRTPAELLDIIEAKQKEIAELIAALRQ
jgi:hypothetical protein